MFGDEYEPEHPEGPEARMHREKSEAEKWLEAAAEKLIDSLTPGDAQLELFSFHEITTYGLRQRRKYPRGGIS